MYLICFVFFFLCQKNVPPPLENLWLVVSSVSSVLPTFTKEMPSVAIQVNTIVPLKLHQGRWQMNNIPGNFSEANLIFPPKLVIILTKLESISFLSTTWLSWGLIVSDQGQVTVGKGSDGLVFLTTVVDRRITCQKGYSKPRYDIWQQKKADRVYLATRCLPSQT